MRSLVALVIPFISSVISLFKKILPKKRIVISDKSIKEYSILKKICKKRELHLINALSIKKKLEKNLDSQLNEFQLKNLSMATVAAQLCNLKEKKIYQTFKKIKDVGGRMQLIKSFPNG